MVWLAVLLPWAVVILNHVIRRYQMQRLAMPPLVLAGVLLKDAVVLGLVTAVMIATALVLAIGVNALNSFNWLSLLIPTVLGVGVGAWLSAFVGVPTHITSAVRGEIVPHRYRSFGAQLLWERAAKHAVDRKWVGREELAQIEADAPRRAHLVTRYLDETAPTGWVTVTRDEARHHEAYYQQGPIARLCIGFFVGLVLSGLLLGFQRVYPTVDAFSVAAWLMGYVYGAAVLPAGDGRDLAVLAAAVFVFLLFTPLPLRRVLMTAALGCYLVVSLQQLPVIEQRLVQFPTVQALLRAQQQVQAVERDVRDLARIPLIGPVLAEAARNTLPAEVRASVEFYQLVSALTAFTPRALFGLSLVLWVVLFARVTQHLWLTDAGNIYFARRLRRPVAFGAPTPGAAPMLLPAAPQAEAKPVEQINDEASAYIALAQSGAPEPKRMSGWTVPPVGGKVTMTDSPSRRAPPASPSADGAP